MAIDPLTFIDGAIKDAEAELQKLQAAKSALKGESITLPSSPTATRAILAKGGSKRAPRRRYKTVTIPERTDRNGVTRREHKRRVRVG